MSDCLWPHHGLLPARLLYPWDSPGKNTGVGCHALLQEIFLTQEWNPGLLPWRQILYQLSYQGSPMWNARSTDERNSLHLAVVINGTEPLAPERQESPFPLTLPPPQLVSLSAHKRAFAWCKLSQLFQNWAMVKVENIIVSKWLVLKGHDPWIL